MALFQLGAVVATPGALQWCEAHKVNPLSLIGRHIRGDWGDLGADDISANVDALAYDGRVLSSYQSCRSPSSNNLDSILPIPRRRLPCSASVS